MATNKPDRGARVLVTAQTLQRILRSPRTLVDHLLLAVALGPPRAHHAIRGEAPEPRWREQRRRVEQRPRPGEVPTPPSK